jgi:hypothetical protein
VRQRAGVVWGANDRGLPARAPRRAARLGCKGGAPARGGRLGCKRPRAPREAARRSAGLRRAR